MRQQFTFYRSYWEAIAELPKKSKMNLYEAICRYALDGEAPELTGVEKSVFLLIQPTLDTSARRAESGQLGGSAKSEAKPKQSRSKAEANPKQTAREKEIEKEIEYEYEVESDSLSTRAGARELPAELPAEVRSVEEWYSLPGYDETKARIALMNAVKERKLDNEDEAQRWAALAEYGGLRVDRKTLTAP